MLSLFKSKTVFTVCSLGGLALWSRLISPARRAPQSADPTLMSAARRLFSGVCGGLYGRPEEGARAGVRSAVQLTAPHARKERRRRAAPWTCLPGCVFSSVFSSVLASVIAAANASIRSRRARHD
ncbi:hypothetical protein Purlil1_9313 [Purpureocillium lilacinum]|uniref:Secreted protein n=1 Tax=Purpureocillium lilacinum TaxID=33203 RepID=A0ABR0BRB0_PURLI|nr:hypothetical protein Purlil1_9313 [Purpureocillium lilacinum]